MRMRILFVFIITVFLLHSFGCSTMHTKLEPTKIYKMDIGISTKNPDRDYVGTAALPRKDLYTLEFTTEDKIDVLSFRTCSREFVIENPGRVLNRKKFTYNYRPNQIEMAGNCSAEISALNKDGLFSTGYIDFQDEYTTLSAHNICGAVTEDSSGVSVCMEKVGSVEKISFDVDVKTSPEPGCDLESGNTGRNFEFKVKRGKCPYIFIEQKPPYKIHRYTVHGYESIQFRL